MPKINLLKKISTIYPIYETHNPTSHYICSYSLPLHSILLKRSLFVFSCLGEFAVATAVYCILFSQANVPSLKNPTFLTL